jgi:DNA adenine methylase
MQSQNKIIVSPPITWFGSKSRLVKQITSYFPKHHTFVDVFGGSGAIILGKEPSKVEVYNDLNNKLVTLFRVLANPEKSSELERRLKFTPYARTEFERCKKEIDTLDDEIEIARQLLVIQRQSYGGNGKEWSYCVDATIKGYSASVRKFHAGIERLSIITHRLRKVQIDNRSWELILDRYDREQTLFYLDPPYIPSTRIKGSYEHELTAEDHERLVARLLDLKGYAILSGYSHEIYKPLELSGWKRVDIDTFAFTSKKRTERTESLWLSPNCLKNEKGETKLVKPITSQKASAYRTHKIRVDKTESLIKEAIDTLKRSNQRITKLAVAEMIGISRVHLSRRYANLFK